MKYETASSFFSRNEYFFITAHETPDADAIGSEYALFAALRQLGKTVRVINADPTPIIVQFIDAEGTAEVLDETTPIPDDLDNWSLVILDTNDIDNIGKVRDHILDKVKEYYIIDHHEIEGYLESGNLIEVDASSTCEVLFELFTEMQIDIDVLMAQALYAGIVYDTGSFIYPKTTAKTFGIARKLVEVGVNPNAVYVHMFEKNSVSSLVLQSFVLGSLTLYHDNQVAVQKMPKQYLIDSEATYEESQTLINTPMKSDHIRVSVFFKENTDGVLRCSLRSKGNIDVASIARDFGGGGHRTAAGFKTTLSIESIEKKVLDKLSAYFQ
ncbi:MAG: DHH family phosphoesterase [Spirochaetales bacterium]|nr:DHH family phosphoesterase [Spirochaetales bacterium]